MKHRILLLAAILLPVLKLQAIVDTNENGLSDVWEKQHNSDELFPENFDAEDDPDADGWTNAQEAAAGTDPSSFAPPNGYLQPQTTHIPETWGDMDNDNIPDLITPEVIQVSWPTTPGKQYTLQTNPDLAPENWITVDSPFIGTGTEVSYNFVRSAASKAFWRISVVESGMDSDGDGLVDSEEFLFGSDLYASDSDKDGLQDTVEFTAGTSPVFADTDGDGVTDQDELSNNQLDPLAANDLDEDDIPDDFETHFSQQLLNFNSDPVHWGNRFIELQNDDLEATWDYTEEGVTALEVYLIFAESLAKDGNSSGYWIEPMARNNKFSYAYNLINPPPGSAEGLYRESKPGDFDTIETITNPASFTGGYLSARILNVPWKHDLIPYRIEFNPIYIKHFSQSSAGFKTIDLPDENGTNFQGHIERKRLRLVATRPDHEPFSMDCVKVTDETEFWHGDFLANVTSESLTLTIPKGKLFSDWIETAAPMGTNKDFAQYIVPCDIVVVFGKGPGGFVGNQSMTSRAYLEQYLATIKIAKHGNNWVVREESGLHSGIKIAEDENSLIQALSTPTTTVVFDGHANFGLGPNFSLATHKTIGSFTNFGTGDKTATPDPYTNETPDTYATGIPITYRGDGTEPDVLSEFLGHSPRAPENEVAFGQMAEEGWVYLVPDSTEIKGSVTNFTIPHMDGRWKFESAYGTSAGATLAKSGSGLGEFHYVEVGQSPRLIVSAPKDDLPPLRYKRLFYNSCSSGPHFIANFEHGEFIYTNRACHVFRATQVFLEGLLNNNPINQILEDLNQPDVGDEDPEFDIYKIATF